MGQLRNFSRLGARGRHATANVKKANEKGLAQYSKDWKLAWGFVLAVRVAPLDSRRS